MSSIYYALGLLLCALAAQAENLTKEQQRILLDLQEAHLILEQAKAREAEDRNRARADDRPQGTRRGHRSRAAHCPRAIRARPRRAATGRFKFTARLPQLAG